MATCSSILAWSIPWREEPSGPQSMGSQRVRNKLVTKQQQRPNNPNLCKLFREKGKKEHFPTQARTELEKKLKISLSHKHECKSPEQNSKQIQTLKEMKINPD